MKKMLLLTALVLAGLAGAAETGLDAKLQRQADRRYEKLLKEPAPALRLTAPRLPLSAAERQKGEALLETFGATYLPNAYGAYEKAKEAAQVIQQVFCEEFPRPSEMTPDAPEWKPYCKTLKRLCEHRTASFALHDQLCHYYVLHKMGLVDPAVLAQADAAPLAARLPGEELEGHVYEPPAAVELQEKHASFAGKYMPECLARFRAYDAARAATLKLLGETAADTRLLDAVRTEPCQRAGEEKVARLTAKMDGLAQLFQQLYMDHRIGDLTSDDLARRDHATALELKPFTDGLPSFIAANSGADAGTVEVAGIKLVKIPCRRFLLGATEVTQAQWVEVMGDNPSLFKGADRPVENVSWNDCQAFIKKLNADTKVQAAKIRFRLPTEKEWAFACRAGGTGDLGLTEDSDERSLDAMGWYVRNSGEETHPVARKTPNAFGLFDMHGNVWEWCADAFGSYRVRRGGCWEDDASRCASGFRDGFNPVAYGCSLGFRLAASQD